MPLLLLGCGTIRCRTALQQPRQKTVGERTAKALATCWCCRAGKEIRSLTINAVIAGCALARIDRRKTKANIVDLGITCRLIGTRPLIVKERCRVLGQSAFFSLRVQRARRFFLVVCLAFTRTAFCNTIADHAVRCVYNTFLRTKCFRVTGLACMLCLLNFFWSRKQVCDVDLQDVTHTCSQC